MLVVPNQWRGDVSDFLDWLSTNNGAHRPIASRLSRSPRLINAFDDWTRRNPELVLQDEAPSTVGFGF